MKMSDQPDPHAGTNQAMAHLRFSHAYKIAYGKYVAVRIALKKLTVHSRDVRDAMFAEGIIDGAEKEFWLGTVFKDLRDEGVLKWTGQMHKYTDAERGIHERTIKLWEYVEKAEVAKYLEPPPKPVST